MEIFERSADARTLQSAIEKLNPLSWTDLRLTTDIVDGPLIRCLGAFSGLTSLSVEATTFSAHEWPLLENMKMLHFVSFRGVSSSDVMGVRDWLAHLGLVEMKDFSGMIGDFSELETESHERSFWSDDYSGSLRSGDHLTVYDAQGHPEFRDTLKAGGSMRGLWKQRGVAAALWDRWFNEKRKATLRTWRPTQNHQVYILDAHGC